MKTKKSLPWLLLLCVLCVTSSLFSAETTTTTTTKDPRTLPTPQLIQYLVDKYQIYSPEYVRTWDTEEELTSLSPQQEPEEQAGQNTPICRDVHDPLLCETLAVIAGFKPIMWEPVRAIEEVFDLEPLLEELLLGRSDCPFKFNPELDLRDGSFSFLVLYNSANEQSVRNAYIHGLYSMQQNDRTQFLGDKNYYYEQAYVTGSLYGYPDHAIRGYVGNEHWQESQELGKAWLAQYANKTNEQLEIQYYETLRQKLLKKILYNSYESLKKEPIR